MVGLLGMLVGVVLGMRFRVFIPVIDLDAGALYSTHLAGIFVRRGQA